MPDDLSPRPLHGRADRSGIPVAIERNGQPRPVVAHRIRWDLAIAFQQRHGMERIRHYWEFRLGTDELVVAWKDVSRDGWYEDPTATKGAEADAACAEIERKAQESVARLRAQAAEVEARAAKAHRL